MCGECPCNVREKLMGEIDDLERDKPEVSEYNKKWFDPGLFKDEWWCVATIYEQIGVLMEESRVMLLPSIN